MTRRAIAAVAGVALFATLFAPWFEVTQGWIVFDGGARTIDGSSSTLTAWEAFWALDVLLAVLALAMLTPLARLAAPLALGIVASVVVAGEHPAAGAWLALAVAAVGVGATWRFGIPRRLGRLRRAEPFAGLGGLFLLVALFLDWYGIEPSPDLSGEAFAQLERIPGATLSIWEAHELLPVALLIAAALAIAVPVVSLIASGPARAIGAAALASAVGWIGIALVLYALVSAPEDWPDLRAGAWLALAGAVLAWVGSWLSMRDETTPGAAAPDVPRRPAPA
ncbi:hypothetical protein [Solirubrobacter soli]|uniref:hypothetical protein n=1 Tax=Solirubrobacter soli TaxID=363832 RepID=UPI00042A40B3|nr:hypothetical protein [Solirubrobacter soli]